MTEAEAIKELTHIAIQADENSKASEATGIAIQALEKQIPKKPIEMTDRYPKGQYECPTCRDCSVGWHKTYMTSFGEMQSERMVRLDYCPSCGQAIDWSEDGQ